MKKVLSILFSTMFFAFSIGEIAVFAEEDENQRFVIDRNSVLDTETGKTYGDGVKLKDGIREKLTLEELKKALNESQNQKLKVQVESELSKSVNEPNYSIVVPEDTYYEYYTYDEEGTYEYYGESKHVSAWQYCEPGGPWCPITLTIGQDFSESFTITGDGPIKAITLGASFQWTSSSSITTSQTLYTEPGKTGRLRFMPLYDVTYGVLTTHRNAGYPSSTQNVRGYSPATTGSGSADGVLYIEYS